MTVVSSLFMDYWFFIFFILCFDILGIINLICLPICDDNETCWLVKVWIFRILWVVCFFILGLVYLFDHDVGLFKDYLN